MDEIEQAPEHVGTPAAQPALATEPKPDTDVNPVSQAQNLRFPILEFFSEDPDLWFFQLEATFIVNRVTSEKDKYAVVVANLPFKVVRRIPRNLVTETKPYTTLKELVVKGLSRGPWLADYDAFVQG